MLKELVRAETASTEHVIFSNMEHDQLTAKFYNIDCLEFLSTIPADSIDYINTDPPYFIGFDGGAGWDSAWDSEQEYLDWCQQWTQELVRVLKPNRMLSVWGTLKTDTFLRYKLDVLNSFPVLAPQTEIIWAYNWGGRTKKNFALKHEYCWNYSKIGNSLGLDVLNVDTEGRKIRKNDRSFLFNADDVRVERKMKNNPRTGEAFMQGTIPVSIFTANNHTGSKDFINWHPTTKNIDVLSSMIKAYSNVGDTVLDCFLGSGSSAVAALRNHRNVIGCEQSDEYFEKMKGRIQTSTDDNIKIIL